MNTFTSWAAKGAAVAALTGIVGLAGAGIANAEPVPAQPTAPAVTAAAAPSNTVQSTRGYNLINYSAETLDFVKTTNGLPNPPTAPLLPGETVNFEMHYPVIGNPSAQAIYNVMNPDGTPDGTLTLTFTPNAQYNWSSEYQNNSGAISSTVYVPDNGTDNLQVQDAKGSAATTQTLVAGSAAEQSMIATVAANEPSALSFAATSQTTGYSAPRLLAEGYNGGTEVTNLTANNGYTDSTTDTWGASVTAQAELGPITSSVQASYSHAVSASTDFSTSYQTPIPAGDTAYIWAQIPQYVDQGTFTVHLGNTTFTLPGVTIYNAIPKAAIMYSNTQAAGNVPQPLDPGSHN